MKFIITLSLLFIGCLSFSQSITSVNPSSGYQGTYSLPVTISGVNTNFDQATVTYVEFKQGSGTTLDVSNVNSITSNTIDLDLQIKQIDSVGFYDVNFYGWYSQGIQEYSAPMAFEVLPTNISPSLIMSSPQNTVLDQATPINVATVGTHFMQATSTTIVFSQGTSTIVYPNSGTFNTDTSYAGNFSFSSGSFAVGDSFDLMVYNDFDGLLTKSNAIKITSPTSINGNVLDTVGFPVACMVELYQRIVSYNSQISYVLYDSIYAANGGYAFGNIPDDYYIVRAVPDPSSGLSSAYYNSINPGAQMWSDAEVFSSSVSVPYNIYLNSASTQIGTASISGTLTSADGLNKQFFPVVGARITCTSGSNFYETTTSSNGYYLLSGLPYGTYNVVVDIPGKTQNVVSTVTLSSANESVTDFNYLVYQDQIIRSYLGIEEKEKVNLVKVYPNPSSDYIIFELEKEPLGNIQLKIFDGTGKLIQTTFASGKTTQIDISALSSGRYFLSGIINGKVCLAQIIKK